MELLIFYDFVKINIQLTFVIFPLPISGELKSRFWIINFIWQSNGSVFKTSSNPQTISSGTSGVPPNHMGIRLKSWPLKFVFQMAPDISSPLQTCIVKAVGSPQMWIWSKKKGFNHFWTSHCKTSTYIQNRWSAERFNIALCIFLVNTFFFHPITSLSLIPLWWGPHK